MQVQGLHAGARALGREHRSVAAVHHSMSLSAADEELAESHALESKELLPSRTELGAS